MSHTDKRSTGRRVLLLLALPGLLATTRATLAQSIERVSVSTTGAAANLDVAITTRPSDDGRFVAFTTFATNLVAPDNTLNYDVFLRDRTLGTTARLRTDAIVGDMTPDGRLLSYYRALAGAAAVLDIAADTEVALSSQPDFTSPGRFSADGRFVLYAKVFGSVGPDEVWRRELASGTDDLVSATFNGTPNTISAVPGFLSADGTIATFTTVDPNIVPGDSNLKSDAFYKDYGFGFTDRVSVDAFGGELPGYSDAGAVTPDTRYFVFTTESPAVATDTNGTWDVYVADRFLGELRRASVDSAGQTGNASSQSSHAWISNDGTRVIFDSLASNLVGGDTNATRDVFEHDFLTNATRRLVLGVGGAQADADIDLRGVSTDGRYLTVLSRASNLVPGPSNGASQVYLVDLGPQCFVVDYCSALPNSTGLTAAIQFTGTPSFAVNNFVLSTFGVPDGTACVFFHGTVRADPPAVFGDGLRCVGGTVKRLGTLNAFGDTAIQSQDLNSLPYAGLQPGDVRRFQMLYRDAASVGAGFNTSAALEVTFCP